MTKSNEEILNESRIQAYQTTTELHKYFLSWRDKLLAGYLAILAALSIAFNWAKSSQTNFKAWVWIIGLFSILLTIFFWLLEYRNRHLYRACQNVAQNLEKQMCLTSEDNCGIYNELNRSTKKSFINHSLLMDLFFAIACLSLIVLTILFLYSIL